MLNNSYAVRCRRRFFAAYLIDINIIADKAIDLSSAA